MTMLEIDQMNVKLFSKVCEGKCNETILSSGLIHDPCVKCAQKPPCKKLRKCLKKLEAGSPSTPAPTLQSFSSDDSASSKKMTKKRKNKKTKRKIPKRLRLKQVTTKSSLTKINISQNLKLSYTPYIKLRLFYFTKVRHFDGALLFVVQLKFILINIYTQVQIFTTKKRCYWLNFVTVSLPAAVSFPS